MNTIIMNEVKEIAKALIPCRRHLHENPELGLECLNTRDYVAQKLTEMGYDVTHIGHAGLCTTIGNKKTPVFLLRADMDALPILENTNLEFKSKIDGRMHACGHDMHTTMLLGAAQYFKNHEDEINGTIKLMFQPGEETMQGAKDMIEHGVLQNPTPDAGMMVHVMTGVPLDIGTLVFMPHGPCMASVDWFDIKIQGKGGHGSSPYLGMDPLLPATAILQTLQTIQSRELPPNALVSLTVGALNGPQTSNVINDDVTLGGTIRTYNEKHRSFIKERIVEIADHIAKAYRCTAEITFPVGAPYLKSSKVVSDCAYQALKPIVGDTGVIAPQRPEIPVMGSEDFAYISHEIPVTSVMIVASDARTENDYPLHHPSVTLDEDAIAYGILTYTQTALNWLNNNA